MAILLFSSELSQLTGVEQYLTAAPDCRSLIAELLAQFPKLDKTELLQMAIVIDGVIIPDPYLDKIPEDAELHLIHFVAGG